MDPVSNGKPVELLQDRSGVVRRSLRAESGSFIVDDYGGFFSFSFFVGVQIKGNCNDQDVR